MFLVSHLIQRRSPKISLVRLFASSNVENEVERKFQPSPHILNYLERHAKKKVDKVFTDTYFDTKKFDLTTKDLWLRYRNETLELKWPMKMNKSTEDFLVGVDFYHESTDLKKISEVIYAASEGKISFSPSATPISLEDSISLLDYAQIFQFVNILTRRTRYTVEVDAEGANKGCESNTKQHLFFVDIDRVSYSNVDNDGVRDDDDKNNEYLIGEVEMIAAGGGMPPDQALQAIFQHLQINPSTVRGKVLEFLHRFRPNHFKALEESGLIEGKLGPQGARVSTPWAERLLSKASVNLHFSRRCNFECKFCFHTAKTSHVLSLPNLLQILEEVRRHGAEKINFAGGEPFLPQYRELLGEMVKGAKAMGFSSVSIISNGSQSASFPSWFDKYGQYLDILGISIDTLNPSVNLAHGRHEAGASPEQYLRLTQKNNQHHLKGVRAAADICRQFNVKFKINTVVTKYNKDEDMTTFIEEMNPIRWKVFQVLPLIGENCGTPSTSLDEARLEEEGGRKARRKKENSVEPFLISSEEFDRFVGRHKQQLRNPSILKEENNAAMQSSYILIDEYGRFLDSSLGEKVPTQSILDVGMEKAAHELLNSAGGKISRLVVRRKETHYEIFRRLQPRLLRSQGRVLPRRMEQMI